MIRPCVIIVLSAVLGAHALGLVVTELHRDPAAGNKSAIPGGYSHSFVEVANFGPDTFFLGNVFLTNGKVCDSIRRFDAPIPGHESCVFDADYIPPGGVAVILPQNYLRGLEADPSTIHPVAPGAIMLTVHNRNLGGGMANDDGTAVFRGTRARIDSLVDLAADHGVEISAPLSGKIVLSQRQPKGVSVVPLSLLFGERRYIVSPKEALSPGRYEPLRDGLYMEYTATMVSQAEGPPSPISPQTVVRCSVAGIFVTGGSEGAAWRLYSRSPSNNAVADIDAGTFGGRDAGIQGRRSGQGGLSPVSPQGQEGGQRQFLLIFDIVPEQLQYVFEVRTGDGRVISFPIDLSTFWADAGTLVITELYPKGGTAAAGQPEWFELKNVSAADVNLNGWMFGNSKDTAAIITTDFILPPGQYAVASKDTAALLRKYRSIPNLIRPVRWLTLNSFNDTLRIRSPRGILVDMAVYRSAWFTGWSAQSLERVFTGGMGGDSSSWVLCANPTPGGPGGAARWRGASKPSIEAGPTPFSPNGDGIDDFLSIRMTAPAGLRATVRIFSFDGKLLKTFTGEREQILWDGTTDAGRPAAPGAIYIIAEFTSGGTRQIVRKRGILWR
ncbi:MAG: lamin tail domain-containing protein [Chitinispirillia bacterium]|nr:lamin tail domain-containing protein [Chitinispirillia bacterium]